MKVSNMILLMLCFSFVSTSIFAQKQKKEEKVIIIKSGGDSDEEMEEIIIKTADGKEEKVIVVDGDNVKVKGMDDSDFHWVEAGEGAEKTMEVNVNVEETDGNKEYRIRIKDEEGKEELIEWKGEGDMPEEMRKELEAKGVHLFDMKEMEIDGEKQVKVIVEMEDDGGKKKKRKKKNKTVTKKVIVIETDDQDKQ